MNKTEIHNDNGKRQCDNGKRLYSFDIGLNCTTLFWPKSTILISKPKKYRNMQKLRFSKLKLADDLSS